MNTCVSYETAKLLKEKGFDTKVRQYYGHPQNPHIVYDKEDYSIPVDFNKNLDCYNQQITKERDYKISAPTIAEVVMWIYEKHKLWITVDCTCPTLWTTTIIDITNGSFRVHPTLISVVFVNKHERLFGSPTEAYEGSIEYVLNNLIKVTE